MQFTMYNVSSFSIYDSNPIWQDRTPDKRRSFHEREKKNDNNGTNGKQNKIVLTTETCVLCGVHCTVVGNTWNMDHGSWIMDDVWSSENYYYVCRIKTMTKYRWNNCNCNKDENELATWFCSFNFVFVAVEMEGKKIKLFTYVRITIYVEPKR